MHVLIGKDRRVTLTELQAVALGDYVLELHAPNEAELPEKLTLEDLSSTLLTSLSISGNDENKLTPSDTLASLTLLALSVPRLVSKHGDQLVLTSALVDLVNVLKQSKTPLCLPKTDLVSSLAELLPECISSILKSISLSSPSLIWLASGCLAAVQGNTLARAATPIAALSAESSKACLAAYNEHRFDVQRPHRGMITTAAAMRAILQSSKYVTAGHHAPPTLSAAEMIPLMHGPALEHLKACLKTLELEFNCVHDFQDGEVNAVASLALREALDAIHTLCQASLARQGMSETSSGASRVSDQDLVTALQSAVSKLEETLVKEATTGCSFVKEETATAEKEAQEKDRAKEVARASAPENCQVDKKDEFEGMTEAQKAKILKKRAEKEAKAAAKRAAKKDKVVSLFGTGIQPIVDVLEKRETQISEDLTLELEDIVDKLLSGGVQRKPKIPKGTRDYLPEQMMIRQQAFSIIRRVFESHGAVEIDTPVFELKDTLTGKYGEDSKLIYDLADQGGELLALRYDLTVPFARFLALNAVGNIKRFHIGKVYRRDQPALSKGRYREFYQCDFDIAGNYGRMVPDSESLCVACEILDALPIGDFAIKVNHRRLLDAILDICGVPADKFRTICSAVDKLDKEPWSEVRREMVEDKGLDPVVADKIGTFVLDKGDPWTMYKQLMDSNKFGKHKGASEALEDMRILFEYLEAMDKLKFMSFDMSLARGLDYYTGVIYEAVCMSGNTQVGSIGGGGRYDNLVSMFQEAGKITPCVGVSVGIERVFTLMETRFREEQGGSIKQANVNVLVASVGENMMVERMKLAKVLWDANISAEFSQKENPKLKYELQDALERGIPFVAIVGEDEVKEKACNLKDLKARTEEKVPVDQLVAVLRSKGVIPVGCEFAAELLNSQETTT